MKLHELLALIKSKAAEMQAIVDGAGDTMSDEDGAKFDALEGEIVDLKAAAERLRKLEGITTGFEPQPRAATPDPAEKIRTPTPDPEITARGGFDNIAEFALSVKAAARGVVDDRLKFLAAPSSEIHVARGSDDGYMVPEAFKAEVFEVESTDFNMLPLLDTEPTGSNAVKMLRDETTPWGSRGIQAYWTSEAGQITRSALETKGTLVSLHKIAALVEASDEINDDAPLLSNRITRGANRAINWKLNEAVLEGDGVGKPLGFNNSPSKIVVAAESGQGADTVVLKNLTKMYRRSTNPAGSHWLINASVLDELMEIVVGDRPVWLPPNGIIDAPGGILFGRPVHFSENCDLLGDEGDIRFVDPMGYYMPNRGTIKTSESMHLLFDFDSWAYKWTFRAGGTPYLSAPVEPNKGTPAQKAANSRSSYLVLGERS